MPKKARQAQPVGERKQADRPLHDLARRAMSARLSRPVTPASATEAMQGSCGELFAVLETAMGPGGLQALIGRAIQVTARSHPWLASVRPGTAADCPLSGLAEAAGTLHAEEALEGYAALLANVVSLLITFIGEDLTARFVRHAWPQVAFSKLSEGARE